MKKAYVIDCVRTPIGKYGGGLSMVRPDDLLAHVIKVLINRNAGIDLNDIEDVIAGASNQSGEDNRNVARMSALLAGLPVSVAGSTVNRLCASGMQAIMDASRAIMCGDGDILIAGGVESMTRAPFVMSKNEGSWNRNREIVDSTIGWRFTNEKLAAMYHPYSMGETAEHVATQWNISREEQDEFAAYSHQKYFQAKAAGKWQAEIAPVETVPGNRPVFFADDEYPRQTSMQMLARLKPAFVQKGTVTAGNSSGLNDGAAAFLIASQEAVDKYQLKPMASIVSMSVTGIDPYIMGIAPVTAIKKVLHRSGLQLSDVDLIELNEAFAVQSIACIRELKLDENKVNVNGGAIALGNPIGCGGARITTTLIHEMKRTGARYGLASMCVGVGQGTAMIVENYQ